MEPVSTLFVLRTSLTLHGEDVVLEPDGDLLGINARDIELQADAFIVLEDIGRWLPARWLTVEGREPVVEPQTPRIESGQSRHVHFLQRANGSRTKET